MCLDKANTSTFGLVPRIFDTSESNQVSDTLVNDNHIYPPHDQKTDNITGSL